jgi:ribonuclease BN (tRNA processing enzyme)
MRLEVLGCSGGIGGQLRTTALLLDADVLIDAGTGVADLSLSRLAAIDHVFVTHSHLDHVAAIAWLVDTVGSARSTALTVHGLSATVKALKEHIFNWKIWPDFTQIPNSSAPYLGFEEISIGRTVRLGGGREITPIPANHVVPAVGYHLNSGAGSLIFSGDTGANDALWDYANACENLRHLIVETAFSDRDSEIAIASKHLHPSLLARELTRLERDLEIYITHMKPGEEERIMAEVAASAGKRILQRLENGQVFDF